MSHSFSGDLRWRVIQTILAGLSTRKAARRFRIGVSTAGEWYRRYRDHGETTARKQGQPSGSKLDAHEAFILGLVEETPDMALHEIAERLTCRLTRPTSTPSNWRSQNSRPCSAKPPPGPPKTSSKPSPRPSISSHLKNAPISSNMPDMATDKLNML